MVTFVYIIIFTFGLLITCTHTHEGITAAVEGSGNVGSYEIEYLAQLDVKVVVVSDSKGCIYNPDGLEYERLSKVKMETRSVIYYIPGARASYAEYRDYNPKQMLKLVQRKIRRNIRIVLEYSEEKMQD